MNEPARTPRARSVRELVVVTLIALALYAALTTVVGRDFGTIDLVQYWSAARVALAGGNPYDPAALLPVQQGVLAVERPTLMWNPPLILPIIAPLSLLPFRVAAPLWAELACLLALAGALLSIRAVSVRSSRQAMLRTAIVLATFYPLGLSLSYGQISPLLLAAFAGFLFFDRSKNARDEIVSGILLSVTLIKPYLLYLLFLVIMARALRLKRWRPLAGLALGAALLAAGALAIDPRSFSSYAEAMTNPPIYWRTPTIGSFVQGGLGDGAFERRMVPTIVCGILAAIGLLIVERERLRSHVLLLVLVPIGLVTAPYGWVYDYLLLVPVVAWLLAEPSSGVMFWVLIVSNLLLGIPIGGAGQEWCIWYPAVIALLSIRKASRIDYAAGEMAGSTGRQGEVR